jgi:hypothetical protein
VLRVVSCCWWFLQCWHNDELRYRWQLLFGGFTLVSFYGSANGAIRSAFLPEAILGVATRESLLNERPRDNIFYIIERVKYEQGVFLFEYLTRWHSQKKNSGSRSHWPKKKS